jgi:Putative peptidoglycan binding domain
MKTSILTLFALTISVALAIPAQAGSNNHIGGGSVGSRGGAPVGYNGGGHAAPRGSIARSGFRSGAIRNFGAGQMYHPGRGFSQTRVYSSSPSGFRQPSGVNSPGRTQFSSRQFAPSNTGRGNHIEQASNRRNRSYSNAMRNEIGPSQVRNANHLRPNWRNHVVAQHSAGWHRDWDRGRDHWWHGRHCRFINGSWVIFDAGFDPWWPYGYPYDYYAYDSGYPYGYDQGAYQDEGYNQDAYGSNDQDVDSTVAVVQQQLARQGYYRGEIDGSFGPETRNALMRYQNAHGLHVSGTFDAETLRVLGLPRTASN